MKYHVDTIIFDFDGCLVDTSPDVTNAANYMFKYFGFAELTKDVIAGYIGGGAESFMRLCLKEKADALIEQATPVFMQRYDDYCFVETYLYPGVREVLQHYKAVGKHLAIATLNNNHCTDTILSGLKVKSFFEMVVGPESVTFHKPHPEALLQVLERTGTPKERAVIVGDRPTDVQAGKTAGIHTCGVTYGYGNPDAVHAEQADVTIDRMIEILEWFD